MKFKSFLLATTILVGSLSTFTFANELQGDVEQKMESAIETTDSDLESIIQLADDQIHTTGSVAPEVSSLLEERGVYKYQINANNVNVRSGAGTSYSSLGQMNWGDVCYSGGKNDVVANGYTWKYVLCGSPLSGTYGWIATTYLIEID